MHAFSMRDPSVLRIRPVFLCGFPFSSLNVTASSQRAEKKGHVSLQNILPAQKRQEKKRKHVSERKTKCFYQARRGASQQNHNSRISWLYHNKPTDESFIFGTTYLNSIRRQVYRPAQCCFCTSDLYPRLNLLLPSKGGT